MNKTLSLLLCVLAAFAAEAFAQDKTEIIPYSEYVTTIISSLPEIKSNGVNVLAQENAVMKAKALSDILITSNGTLGSTTLMQSGDKYKSNTANVDIGVAKKFTSTGTYVGANVGYDRTAIDGLVVQGQSGDSKTFQAPYLRLSVSQPLLNNFLGKVDSFSEKDAEMQLEVEKVRLLNSNKMTLNAYRKMYFEWVMAMRQIDNSRESIRNATTQLNQVRRNYNTGINEEDDYQRAAATLLNYQQSLESNNVQLRNIERYLAVYLDTSTLKPNSVDFDNLYKEAYASDFVAVDFSKTTSARIIDLTSDRLMYAKGVFRNNTLPDLNVTGSYTRKNLTNSPSEQFSSFSENDWRLGFEFVYKLGNNQAEGQLKDIEIQLQALDYERGAAINSYNKNLNSIATSAQGIKDILNMKAQYLTTLNRQLAAERRKYSQGRLNLSYVIATENQIAAEKSNIVNLQYQLISLYIDYLDAIQ